MSIGNRIKYFRKLRGLTQQELGLMLGFSEKTAYVRIAQYEAHTHIPKESLVEDFAECLHVSPQALNVPETDSRIGIMHTLFSLEDMSWLKIDKIDGEICIRLNHDNPGFPYILRHFRNWYEKAAQYRRGTISRDEYDQWRYFYDGKNIP